MRLLATVPKLAWLILLLPVIWGLKMAGQEGMLIFALSGLAILGTVTLIGRATEDIAVYAGPLWGGLLNATFGNVTELIIAVLALQKGLVEIVRSSITGSILGNLLLVLGAAMLYGGLKHPTQKFSRTGSNVNLGMLWLTLITLIVPSLVAFSWQLDPALQTQAQANALVEKASLAGAVVLLSIYVLSLVFSLRTHRFALMPGPQEHEEAVWSKATSLWMLLGSTVAVAFLSEWFVEGMQFMLEHQDVHISQLFVGVIIVAVVGNAAEGSVAIWVARENKMELSYQIAMGSCLQVALMVAPVLVLASFAMGKPMTLAFNFFELASLAAGVAVSSAALQDGESNWLEGAMFLAVYAFFAVVFWFHP